MILLGNRVLIQLDKEQEHATTASGLLVPNFRHEETDGGKLKAKASELTYLPQGTVIDISPYAKDLLEKEHSPLKVGDRVFLSMNISPDSYHFPLNRDSKRIVFDGHIAVPTSLIEAIINNG